MKPRTYHKYTESEIAYMKAHCNDSPADVAIVVGAPINTVTVYMQQIRSGKFNKKYLPYRRYYALYLRKTDELIYCGTAQECADQLGIKLNSFYTMVHKILHGKNKKWDIYIESSSEDECLE